MRKRVYLIACNDKYRDIPFYSSSPINADRNGTMTGYKTGQEKLTKEQLQKEPFIIDPEEIYPVMNKSFYDIRSDKVEQKTKDDVMYEWVKGLPEVAKSFKAVDPSIHLFYIKDEDGDSQETVTEMESIFKAQDLVRENTSLPRMTELGIFLDLPVNQYSISQLQAKVYEATQKYPERIIEYFGNESRYDLFIKKCLHYRILEKSGGYIKVAGTKLTLGNDINDAVRWIREKSNAQYVDNWGRKISDLEGAKDTTEKEEEESETKQKRGRSK